MSSPCRPASRLGAGNPPLHRFRIGLEFMVSGRHDIDDMITHHAQMARLLGEQLELSDGVLDALMAAYEQWDGHGWPGELSGETVPIASRLSSLRSSSRSRTGSGVSEP